METLKFGEFHTKGGLFSSRGGRDCGRDQSRGRGGRRLSHIPIAPEQIPPASWIRELNSLSISDLVDHIDAELKKFQMFLNQDEIEDFKPIVLILKKLTECEPEKKAIANRILAEALSERCSKFHTNLRNSLQKVMRSLGSSSDSVNYIILLSDLCCSLLDIFQWTAFSNLPVLQIKADIQGIIAATITLTSKMQDRLMKASEDLEVRIEHIQATAYLPSPTSTDGLDNGGDGQVKDDTYNYHLTSILPDAEELQSEVPKVPKNLVKGGYKSWEHYYNTQFHLLREDFIAPLRQGITGYRLGYRGRDLQDVRVYDDVRILEPSFSRDGVTYVIQFDATRLQRVNWFRTKRLIYGSLVCLSDDNFGSNIIFASVANRDAHELGRGILHVRPEGDVTFLQWNEHHFYTMVESSAYFEAYRHILVSLKKSEVDTMPFTRYLINVSWDDVSMPSYITNYINTNGSPPQYDITASLGLSSSESVSVLVSEESSWDDIADTQLDTSQMKALKMALTQDLALIQGPPGTGKTYMGIKIVDALCRNRQVWGMNRSPILVVCFTNHALDQFLHGIKSIEIEEENHVMFYHEVCRPIRIARVGGRANESMAQYSLRNIRRGTIPREDYHKLKDYQAQVEKESERMQSIIPSTLSGSSYMHSVDYLMQAMSPLHYEQLCSMAPNEQPDTQLQIWLGLLKEAPPNVRSADDIAGEEDSVSKINKNVPTEDQTMAGPVRGWNLQDVNKPEETEDESESERKDLIDVIDEYAFEMDQRLIDLGDDFPDTAVAENLTEDHVQRVSDVKENWIPVYGYTELVQRILRSPPFEENDVQGIDITEELPFSDRWRLYNYWTNVLQLQDLKTQFSDYNALCQECNNFNKEQDRHALENVDIIGMTTTGAAKYQHILHIIKPKIVIIEEAAEVLESHIVSCLTANTQHLILIGDHQQLRPKPNVYELAKKCNLDISLFERLVRNDFPRVTLEIQHRMRPTIAKLVHPLIYPVLENHLSVCSFEDVLGVCDNLFFIDHKEQEKPNDELKSHSNVHEAAFMAALCQYFIQQGYRPEQITLLCAYTGQLFEVRKHMPRNEFEGVCVRTLDNYQGEENDIVLLTLVRSNEHKKIGFLREEHRVCVALSRARKGFYCIGNFHLLESQAEIWEKLVPSLRERKIIGPTLKLRCQNHPETTTEVKTADDFVKRVPEGGCLKDCGERLECGHVCDKKCHIRDKDHIEYECKKMCPRNCDYGHPCVQVCFKCPPCPPCYTVVEKVMPGCGHFQEMMCSKSPEDVLCRAQVERTCDKGHTVYIACFKKNDPCEEIVPTKLACGHVQPILCHVDPDTVNCKKKCNRLLPCGHQCAEKCYKPCTTQCLRFVEEMRKCGHTVRHECYKEPDDVPCTKPCPKKLPCGHHCKRPCSTPCYCNERIKVQLGCGHSSKKKCSAPDPSCQVQFLKLLYCGHRAMMLCGKTVDGFRCPVVEAVNLPCGHKEWLKCCEQVGYICRREITVNRPCGHQSKVECWKRNELTECQAPCSQKLGCGHMCKGTCSKCGNRRLHQVCNMDVTITLPCGHFLNTKCSIKHAGKCKAKCSFTCEHRKGQHPCEDECPAVRCTLPCQISCIHRGRCEEMCKESCEMFPCNEPCPKPQKCKHPCAGVCGEPCPRVCRECYEAQTSKKRGKKKFEFQSYLQDVKLLNNPANRFVQLPCSHIFEFSFMDKYMLKKDGEEQRIATKCCPTCQKPILSVYRYRNVTKEMLRLVCKVRQLQLPESLPLVFPAILLDDRVELIAKGQDLNLFPLPRSTTLVESLKVDYYSIRIRVCEHQAFQPFADQQTSAMSKLTSKLDIFLSSYLSEIDDNCRNCIPESMVKELCGSICCLSAYRTRACTQQSVHDWIKECWRVDLVLGLASYLTNRPSSDTKSVDILKNKLLGRTTGKKKQPQNLVLSVKEVLQVEHELNELCHNLQSSFQLTLPVGEVKLPAFTSTLWFQCSKGHIYSPLQTGLDIYHHQQRGCPYCSKVHFDDYCTILPC